MITFGYAIASNVVVEKSSRVVEVILAAIRPVQLLAGKLIGVGILGLIQIAVIAAVGLAISIPGGAISLPSSTFETVVLVLIYFVLGYAFYGCCFAAAASLVSRQEDTQSSTGPLMVILIGSYVATNAALGNPEGGLATVGTFLPPMAPLIVPGRAAQGALPGWQLALSLAIMLAAIAVVIVLAGRIYDRSVLRFGTPVKLREALEHRLPPRLRRRSEQRGLAGPPRRVGTAGALQLQQRLLAVQAAAVPGQRTVGTDNPVAGDDDRDRVAAVGGADRAGPPPRFARRC